MQSTAREGGSSRQEPERVTGPGRDGPSRQVVVIGAGPAGLTAAYQLAKVGETCTVLEADGVVGGISRTVERDGWRFDIGGHRFFTKVPEVESLWHEILPDEDFLLRPRKSRIYYRGRYFDYPLRPANALRNLGPVEAVLCVGSYIWARLRPPKDQTNYEGWLVARFGWRLYRALFKTYTEKVWGIPVSQMPADWAAQRVKELSLGKAILNMVTPRRNQKEITSLIEEFQYPKYGPGMMWEACREKVEAEGSKIIFDTVVTRIHHRDGRAVAVTAETAGVPNRYEASDVISSMPFGALVEAMDPPAPPEVRAAARGLRYRDFLTVALVVDAERVAWDDNWIYIHAPEVKTMRIQNFGSWSPYLVKDGGNVLGLEYTVFEGDAAWRASDEELIESAKRELEQLGLVKAADVRGGYVVRQPKAYPIYDDTYRDNVEVLRRWLAESARNVHPVGRNGMHRYNNQDHSMYTALLTVENILGADHDIWAVNVEEEYHEEDSSSAPGDGPAEQSAKPGPGAPRGTGRDAPVLASAALAQAEEARRSAGGRR